MKLKLEIDMSNAAFEDHPFLEVARILRHEADFFEDWNDPRDGDTQPLLDVNGNRVGEWKIKGRPR